MALPTLTKTWQFATNQKTASSGTALTDYKNLVLGIKNALIGFAQQPWTVVGSCDGTTAALDGVDRWTNNTKIVWGKSGIARSWIVLQQTGLLPAFQLCIECYNNNTTDYGGRLIAVAQSVGGLFTGGSTTARPTATDEIASRDGTTGYGYWFYNYTTTFAPIVHAMQSTDGACTRLVLCSGGKSRSLWMFDALAGAPAAMTYPAIWTTHGWTTDVTYLTYAAYNTARRSHAMYGTTKLNGQPTDYWGSVYLTAEGYVASGIGDKTAGSVANDITGEYPLGRIGALSELGVCARLGTLADIWWGSTALADGTTYPADTTKQLAQFGQLVFPWDGSTPVLT